MNLSKLSLSFSLFLIAIALIAAVQLEAMEPADSTSPFNLSQSSEPVDPLIINPEFDQKASVFIVQDVRYQSFDGTARLKIEMNKHVDCVIYELEDPYRVVIDPLDTVWCDFEEVIYFEEGMVRTIEFVRGKDIVGGPGVPYYPFDFITVELRYPYPYNFTEDERIVVLNIGEEPTEAELEEEAEAVNLARIDRAKMMEEEFADESARKEGLAKERKTLGKERVVLERQRIKLAKERASLKRDRAKLKKKKLKKSKQAYEPRPVKEYSEDKIPPDYFGRILTKEDCIQIAMSNSMTIRVTKERVKLARLKINAAFRELFPEISLMLEESHGKISGELYIGRNLGVEFKQVIFHGGEQMYLWEQSKMNLKVAEESLNKQKEELIFDVSKAYYDLAKAINRYNYQKELLENINADFEIAKKEYELELMPEIDFMNVESTMNQSLHTLLSHENSLSLARLELKKAMNIDINANVKIDSKLEPREIDIDMDRCIELAVKFKPEFRLSYFNAEVAELAAKIAKSQTFPQVDVFGKYSKSIELLEPTFESIDNRLKNERILGLMVSAPIGPHTIDYQKKMTKLAPTVTTFGSDTRSWIDRYRVSLFDDMNRITNVKDASVSYQQALDELNEAEQDIHTNIREAFYNFAEAKLKIKNSLNNIELYNRELEVARIKKGLNEISFYELMQAKIKLYGEKGAYTDMLGDYYIAVARINKAIGLGGYFN